MDEKNEILKDGTKVVIRNLTLRDLDPLMAFYNTLSDEDRRFLKVDVTNRSVVQERIQRSIDGDWVRIVAEKDGEIISDGSLELSFEEWRKHQGEIRVIVAPPYRKKGLAILMIRELYLIAMGKKVDLIVAKMMRPQVAALKIVRKLGFKEEQVIPEYVRDLEGTPQDLVVMVCDAKGLWKELEHLYSDSDWQRCR
jgi:ribosomal protein S18 acetylase RimI-like enzyme